MTTEADRRISLMEGEATLPRKNGELVFEAPWESRAFGLAVALCDARAYNWDEFRSRLIERIARDEASAIASTYYERWLFALVALLEERGIVTDAEIDVRAAEIVRDDDHGPH